MKANFNIKKNEKTYTKHKDYKDSESGDISQEELEDFIIKSGAKGSFMVYRSSNKENELGIDEL